MKYPDAYQGVKKIYVAEIIKLISTICMFIAAIFIEYAKMNKAAEAASDSGVPGILVIAAGALALVGLIIEIVGVRRASWDEPSEKLPFFMMQLFRPECCIFVYTHYIGA